MLDKTKKEWWKQAVIYQIYPKSFQDSNGDGIGDLNGIRSRLGYLEQLGIDAIWLSPVLASPQVDNGYDVSDYRDIDPMFGTMEEMKALISEAREHGISIIMDMVFNHSSDQHRWFLEAKKSKDNPYHDYYVWRDGEPGRLPNDMWSNFGGPAWTWVPECGQYYFHQFAPQQPDLNWDNPIVRREISDIVNFWMDLGVEGFRLDVIDSIAKEPDRFITADGPKLHTYLKEFSRNSFQKGNVVSVGEAWSANPETAKIYSSPAGDELSMVFEFEHQVLNQDGEKWNFRPLVLTELKQCMKRWQQGLYGSGWNSLFWENHDLPRIVSKWGDPIRYRVESAKCLAILLFGMQGTPYIFEGQEIGMTNVRLPIEQYDDLEIKNFYKRSEEAGVLKEQIMESIYKAGRDNARTCMQWSAGEEAGFTTGKPWFCVNPNFKEINVEAAMADPDSVFYCYQKLIGLRHKTPVFIDGRFELLQEADEQVFSYLRTTDTEEILVYGNMSGEEAPFELPQEMQQAKVLISNQKPYTGSVSSDKEDQGAFPGNTLKPWEAGILYRGKFYTEDISRDRLQQMAGKSFPTDPSTAKISPEDLEILHVQYYDFHHQVCDGEIICHRKISQDLKEIFEKLFQAQYEIEQILPVDVYDGDDERSMEADNSSCFNYRVIYGTDRLSHHSLGCAIDINPKYNPYISYHDGQEVIQPANSLDYVDRSRTFPHKIDHEDLCYRLFTEHGFTWGGDWTHSKDYQHFEKLL